MALVVQGRLDFGSVCLGHSYLESPYPIKFAATFRELWATSEYVILGYLAFQARLYFGSVYFGTLSYPGLFGSTWSVNRQHRGRNSPQSR